MGALIESQGGIGAAGEKVIEEDELRWLVFNIPDELQGQLKSTPHHFIRQVYPPNQPRVRETISDGVARYTKTKKLRIHEDSRIQRIERITQTDEERFLGILALHPEGLIEKVRHFIKVDGYEYHLDLFTARFEGLKFLEFEFPGMKFLENYPGPPAFAGPDISNEVSNRGLTNGEAFPVLRRLYEEAGVPWTFN